ncbi:MAG: hypothetical protein K1562_04200 [Candidatus Thiodiazotropha sp. (ex. Lucinisca nassula)]|nr:hypothetical protein [Candidatus Thiodiazotropha sp. (ex. Lucinisca nassula)]
MSSKPTLLICTLLVSCFSLAMNLQAEEKATEQSPNVQNKTYTAGSDSRPKLSRKCAIYSGICPMNRRSEVGAYCICNTPSGPIHGVVIP